MRTYLRTILGAFLGAAFLFVQIPVPVHAATGWDIRAASIIPSGPADFGSDAFRQSVRDFRAIGGNYINLVIPYYQTDVFATDISPGSNTPTDTALTSAIDYIHSLGMHVQLSLYLESRNGEWRALIAAGNRDAWFASYGALLNRYGDIAEAHGVELISMGAELVSMASNAQNPDNEARWETMIADLRTHFSGALTYSANRAQNNWSSEVPNIGFWDKLDYIGISAYYELHGDGSVPSLKSAWEGPDSYDVSASAKRFGKPIIFTEIGYRSVAYAHDSPWNSGMGGPYDPQEQVNDYEALFGYWMGGDHPYVRGIDIWNWSPNPASGGPGDTDYTPQGKPVLETIAKWWTTPPAAPPSGFSSSGAAVPNPISPGSPVSLTATVTGSNLSGGIVDLEIYEGNVKVHQVVLPGQEFGTNETKAYALSWTPARAGTYTFKIGVFTSGWAENLSWNDAAATIRAGTDGSGTPPPSGGTIDFWWPTQDAHVSGLQPFKGLLEGADVSQYRMFWKVGNGNLVPMDTNMEGWPHKEALVDLTSWSWEGNGSYTITFVAQDLAGNPIAEKSVEIWIP